jgi:hypothetical protein
MQKFVTALALVAFATGAQANIVFYEGIHGGSGDVENVLLRNGDTGFEVYGDTNITNTEIQFQSLGSELVNVAAGQSRIEALDAGYITDINFGATDPGIGFKKVVFNVDTTVDGAVNLMGVDNFGTEFFYNLAAQGSGQNFVTVIAEDDQWLSRMFIDGANISGIDDLQQIRVGPGNIDPPGPIGNEVPIPAAAWLFGSAILGLGGVARKRNTM